MTDPFKSIITLAEAKSTAQRAHIAAKEMARHCDKRVAAARKALRLIDTFAWSMVHTDTPQADKELMRRVNACRETLKNL